MQELRLESPWSKRLQRTRRRSRQGGNVLGDKKIETNRKGPGSKSKKCKQVSVLGEQEKAGEDADEDIGGLSNASCTASF